jgi:hypothetical protein
LKTKTLSINYDQLTDCIVAHLYALGVIGDDVDVINLDLGIPVDEDGNVDIDLDYVDLRRGSHLTLVSTNDQLELPNIA